MFADSICDSPWANRSRRSWTTLISFAAQAIAVGALLLVPLLCTSGLRGPHWIPVLVAPARAEAPPPAAVREQPPHSNTSNLSADGRMIAPPTIPRSIENVTETVAPPPPDFGRLGIADATGDRGAMNGVLDSVLRPGATVVLPPPPTPRVVHISHMTEGDLIYKVQPEYPMPAKMARIQGAVVLHALISKQGTIENLQVDSGSPWLVGAAIEAVRQWRYRPYLLNEQPVEVDTEVTVNFVLSGN